MSESSTRGPSYHHLSRRRAAAGLKMTGRRRRSSTRSLRKNPPRYSSPAAPRDMSPGHRREWRFKTQRYRRLRRRSQYLPRSLPESGDRARWTPRPSRPRALQRSVAISACGAPAPLRVNALPRTLTSGGVLRWVCGRAPRAAGRAKTCSTGKWRKRGHLTVWVRPRAARRSTNVCGTLRTQRTNWRY